MLRGLRTPEVRGSKASFDEIIQRAPVPRSDRFRFARAESIAVDHLRHEVDAAFARTSCLEEALVLCEVWLECLQTRPDRAYQCLVKCALAVRLERMNQAADATWTDAQRSRFNDLQAKTGLNPLDVDLLRRLPVGDLDSVLSVALQQAVDGPDGSDHLLSLASLFVKLQRGEGPWGFLVARSLRNGLFQVLEQTSASPMDPVDLSRRSWIERQLDRGPLGRFGRAMRTGDLPAAAACVQGLHTLNETLAVEMATELMAAVRRELAQVGVVVEWTTVRSGSAFEDRTVDGPAPFAAVLRAWSVLRRLPMEHCLPLTSSCHRWLQDQLLTEAAKPAVLGLLEGMREDPALQSALMDVFEVAMCSPGAKAADVEALILLYAEHIDLADVLAPIRAPLDPKTAPVTGFDRLCALVLKLADSSSRQWVEVARQDAWRGGWAVLSGLTEGLLEERSRAEFHEDVRSALDLLFGRLWFQKSQPTLPGAQALIDRLWLCTAANGLHSPLDRPFLVLWGLESSPVQSDKMLPFWESPVWEGLFACLAPHAVKGLSAAQQQALLRRNLMVIFSRPGASSPFRQAMSLAGRQQFAQGAEWATALVEALACWADTLQAGIEMDSWYAHDLIGLVQHYAGAIPGWLEAVGVKHPWVCKAITAWDAKQVSGGYVMVHELLKLMQSHDKH